MQEDDGLVRGFRVHDEEGSKVLLASEEKVTVPVGEVAPPPAVSVTVAVQKASPPT